MCIMLFLCFARETICKFADQSKENILAFQHILGFLKDYLVNMVLNYKSMEKS